MHKGSALAIATVLLLLIPGASQAHNIGIKVGDRATYSVLLVTTTVGFPHNDTSRYTTQFTINVLNMGTTEHVDLVGYGLTIDSQNGTTTANTNPTTNSTTIFDPSNNYTYIGSGFFPFVYTDLGNQTNRNLPVSYPINGSLYPPSPSFINSTVVSTKKSIFVSAVIPLATNATANMYWFMKYNTTNGLLESSSVLISQFGTSRDFYYTLLSFSHVNPPIDSAPITYYVAVIVVIFAVLALVAVARRPSRRERRESRVRQKFGKRRLYG